RNDPVPARAHASSCLLLSTGSAPSLPAHSSMPLLAAGICPLRPGAPCWLGGTLLNHLSAAHTFVQHQRSLPGCGDPSRVPGHDQTTGGDRVTDQTPLIGITVLTLAVYLPGPLAAARLTQLGARVIKVEPPIGDPLEGAVAEYYRELTQGQDIRRVDLKTAEGAKELGALAAEADVLLTAMRPRAAAALGLPELVDEHGLVHVEIVGFAGDRADVPGHDLTYQAAHATLVPGTMPTVPVA